MTSTTTTTNIYEPKSTFINKQQYHNSSVIPMAASLHNDTTIKIHERCIVAPPSSAAETCLPLTFFDWLWLRSSPAEHVFFYNLKISESDPSFFFHNLVPKLKTSLYLTLQHFPPLAGKLVWPSESREPFVKFTPADHDHDNGVSLVIAESNSDFNSILEYNTPHQVAESRSFIPHLESTDSSSSVMSLQITLFPNRGFSIGINAHHAVLDGKSSTLFLKAWASLCQTIDNESESPSLVPQLEPFFDRKTIKGRDPQELGIPSAKSLTEILSKMLRDHKNNGRSLKIPPSAPTVEDSVRATIQLTPGDLEKIKNRVLSVWEESMDSPSKPKTLSSFVLTCSYVLVSLAKAIHGVEKERQKFAFTFLIDYRARLKPPIPDNYCGNCVWANFVDTKPEDFMKEDGVFLVAKKIHDSIKLFGGEGGYAYVEAKDWPCKFASLKSEGVEIMAVAGSNRFGVYEIDFGWGKPEKVDIISIDRGGLTIGLAESKDGKGGVEVGLVMNKHAMDLFIALFREGLCDDE